MEAMTTRPIELNFAPERAELTAFLRAHHLTLESDVECAFGIYDENEVLHGCGCAAGAVLKCFAIDESLRGQNGLGTLVSKLCSDRFAVGHNHLFVLTRPHNKALFTPCGFYPVGETEDVLMLENRRNGLEKFLSRLPKPTEGVGPVGAIVMNCNPVTLGHQALIRYASAHCGFLYVFVVEEDRSMFPFADRIKLVQQAAANLPNVQVCPSGPYMISAMTFPTYFLKETEDPSLVQSRLDITIFASSIAPALGITRRFAGSEPTDAVTALYNKTMAEILPAHGIELHELPRVEMADAPISASRVRKLLKEHGGMTAEIAALVPECTARYLTERFGEGCL